MHRLILICAIFLAPLASAQPAAAADESDYLTRVRRLTYEGRRAGEGYYSADGSKMVFQSERAPGNPFFQIYILDFETGETTRVSPGYGKTTCAFFNPDGKKVLFASSHIDAEAKSKQEAELAFRASGKQRRYSWDYDTTMEIFAADTSGKNLVRLTNAEGYDAEGAWSPDGSKIVFCSLRDAYTAQLDEKGQRRLSMDPSYYGEIYIMDADGSNPVRLTDNPGYDGGPFFSPDGERIIWRHFDKQNSANADIYTMKIDGSDKRRITDFGCMSWAPYYHPSGKYIVFASNKLGFSNFEIFMVDTAGRREPVRVTTTDGFDGLPVFHPNGNELSWTSARSGGTGGSQIFLANWNHEAALAALQASPERDVMRLTSSAINANDLKIEVSTLAADDMEGRLTGTAGEQKAGDYLAGKLEALGFEPAGDDGTFFQAFPFTAGVSPIEGQNRLTLSADGATRELEMAPLAFSQNASVTGAVVFAGYGIVAPTAGDEAAYDAYGDMNVSNKLVLVLQGVPRELEGDRGQKLQRYAGLRYKALAARERGAIGVLVTRDLKDGAPLSLQLDQSFADSGLPAASISGAAARALLGDHDFAAMRGALDREADGSGTAMPLDTNQVVTLRTGLNKIRKTGRNVAGYLPPAEGAAPGALMLCAHYDHIGYGQLDSLARAGEEGQVHNGADDNASGCAMVLELAAALAAAPQPRGVLACFWSGEEMGLLGSSYYANNPTRPLKGITACINFDMVGRMQNNRLMLQGTGSSSGWRKLIEKRNVMAGFDLVLQDDPYLPTDVTSFYPKGIPVLSVFTGSHEDYNRPSDDAETLNYEDMERTTLFAKRLIDDILHQRVYLDYVKVASVQRPAGRRTERAAYLGTIPDYAQGEDLEGVKLTGVKAGSPAELGGMQGGDVMVQLGDKVIRNIYDFAYSLDAIEIGKDLPIVVLRDGKRLPLTLVPVARK